MSRFREMEKQHGSLIRAMQHQMSSKRKTKAQSGARYSMFVTLRGGLSTMVEALAARLPEKAIRLNTPVSRIERRKIRYCCGCSWGARGGRSWP